MFFGGLEVVSEKLLYQNPISTLCLPGLSRFLSPLMLHCRGDTFGIALGLLILHQPPTPNPPLLAFTIYFQLVFKEATESTIALFGGKVSNESSGV